MEEESWLIVSSDAESCDSDKIDSDIEAELYSVIHHDADTVTSRIDNYICHSPLSNPASKKNKTPKKDQFLESSPPHTDMYTNFESMEKKELDGNSSSDEVQIISSASIKKRKSDVLDNIIESIQLESNEKVKPSNAVNDTRPYKKQRSNSTGNLKKKSDTKSVLNRTIKDDTSDSDSIIWTEADECDIKLKTNLDNQAIILSSDSFSSDDSLSPFLRNNSFTTSPDNISQPSTSSFNKNSKDLWFINSEDMFRSKRPSSRYHDRAVLHCSNCNLKGHSVKFCSTLKAVKCFICGGSHVGSRCKDRLCYKCFRTGHDGRFCNQRLVSICVHCNMKGHSTEHCPDLWRRYHLTTKQGSIVMGCPLAQNTRLYCFNCGVEGHYGAECQAPRSDRLSFPTWTSVLAYVHPYDTIQRANDIQRNIRLGGIPVWSSTPTFRPIPQQQMPIYRQPPPQFQMPFNRQQRPQKQLPAKKKKNKKKKNNLANNLQTPPGGGKKKKKTNSASQTPESSTKKKTQTEVYFPRTPITPNTFDKRLQNKLRKKQRKLQRQQMKRDSFVNGLHRRLGLLQ